MVKAFVIYNTYRVEGQHAYVYLYGRQSDGKTFLTRNKYKPYFYIKQSDATEAKKLVAIATIEKNKKKSFEGDPLAKVELTDPKDIPDVRDRLHETEIRTYEADIRFTYRFMIDNEIQGSCEIIGKPQHHAFVDCYYEEPAFERTEYQPTNIKTLSLDIENKGKQLYCVSLAGADGFSKVLMVSEDPVEGCDVFPTEKACLEAFCAEVRAYDPDIITGWAVIDYDLLTLKTMCEQQHVPFILGRADDKVRIRTESQFLRESSCDITGRMVLDGIVLLKTSFVRLDDYKLGTAAADLLGEQKLISGTNKVLEIEQAYATDKKKLGAYCLMDSQLVLRILAKKKLIELTIKRSTLTGMQLDRVKGSIASFDSLYLRELAKKDLVAKTHSYVEKPEGITGGYVMESKPGIYDYVIVCDFKSLYPSIMRTLNIDPLSYEQKQLTKSTKEYVVAANGAVFRNTQGILPQILERLHAAREQAKKEKDDVAIGAIKVLMNSFFGVLASPQCRFFSMEVANAITVTGQSIIKRTIELIREKGFDVIYADTDSCFIDLAVDSHEEAEKIGRQVAKDINDHYAEWIPREYKRHSYLELQFDKVFVRFFMPKTRGGESSKKRYAGLRIIKGEEKIDFTGLEFVRRDWTELAKEFQLGILDRIFHKQDPAAFIKAFVEDVKTGRKDNLLVYRKAVRKPLGEYTKTTPQHVKAARLSSNLNGNIIEYYVTIDGPQPVDKRTSAIDYQHYIDKQLEPIANGVLLFYNTNFNDVVAGATQKNLFEF